MKIIFLPVLIALMMTGCGSYNVYNATPVGEVPQVSEIEQDYLIQVNDVIRVTLRTFDSPVNGEVTEVPVRPDGKIYIPMLEDEILVAGYTTDEVRSNAIGQYKKLIKRPLLSVNIAEFAPRNVYVGGEIRDVPDNMPYFRNMTALRAVVKTGYDVRRADLNNVVVIRQQSNGNKPIVMALRLKDAITNVAPDQDILLMPNDVIIVPPKGVVAANDFIRQYINNMVPLPGITQPLGVLYLTDSLSIGEDNGVSSSVNVNGAGVSAN